MENIIAEAFLALKICGQHNAYIGFIAGTALLRCNEGTFRVRKIYGDGNCMFRAISYILWRNEEEHQSLRAMVSP